MKSSRRLIVNADDFGLSPAVTHGIIEAHERGIVTSTSLMVNHGASSIAAMEWARANSSLGVGLHVDLGEWFCRGGQWLPLYEVVPLDDAPAVTTAVREQLDRFRQIVGRNPTHVDSHQHVHRKGAAKEVMVALAVELGAPLRYFTPGIRYCGAFYGQTTDGSPLPDAISVQGLLRTLESLPAADVVELACHPSAGEDVETMYQRERTIELNTLCDPSIRATIDRLGIVLCNFQSARAEASA